MIDFSNFAELNEYLNNPNSKIIRLHDGELNVMELLWANGELTAKDIAAVIKEYIGWEKNTTYTVIKRLIEKGVIERTDPGFRCRALIKKETVQNIETTIHIKQLYNGKLTDFIQEYIAKQKLTIEDVYELSLIVDDYRNGNATYRS